jgi:hypothetical protein
MTLRENIEARIAQYQAARASALQVRDQATVSVIETEAAIRELQDLLTHVGSEEPKADGG